jgi:hypothetical protein
MNDWGETNLQIYTVGGGTHHSSPVRLNRQQKQRDIKIATSAINLILTTTRTSQTPATFPHAEGHSDHTIRPRHPVQAADEVGEVVEHREIVLYHNDVLVRLDEGADGHGSLQALLHVQVRRRLVKHETVMEGKDWRFRINII